MQLDRINLESFIDKLELNLTYFLISRTKITKNLNFSKVMFEINEIILRFAMVFSSSW